MSGERPPATTPAAGPPTKRTGGPRSLHAQFLIFALVGLGNATVDGLVFAFLVTALDWRHGIAPVGANVVGFLAGATHSYAWNSRVTFRSGHAEDSAAVLGQFFSVAVGGAIVSAIAFSIVRAFWPDGATTLAASKLGAIAVGMVWNFSLLRGWVFSNRRQQRREARRDLGGRSPDAR